MKKITKLLALVLVLCLCVPFTAMAAANYYYLEVSIEEDKPDGKIVEENRWTGTSPGYLTEDDLLVPLVVQAINENYTNGDSSTEMYIFGSPAMKKIMDAGLKAYSQGDAAWKAYWEEYYDEVHNLDEKLPLKELLTADGTTIGELELNKEYKISFKNTVQGDAKYGTTYIVTVVRRGYNVGGGDHPVVKPIASVSVKGLNTTDHVAYIIGNDAGLVNPLGTITRAEVATIYFRLMTEEFREEHWSNTNSFTDIPADAWYNVAVSTLEAADVIKDTQTGGQFRPTELITRAELAVMAAQFCTVTGNIPETSFKDVPKTHWAAKEIALVEYAGWIEGDAGCYRPDENLTRAECMTIVNRMLHRGAENENMLPNMVTFPDNQDTETWYYDAVQEAVNSHTYTRTKVQLTGENFYGEKWTAIVEAPDWAALEQEWAAAAQN